MKNLTIERMAEMERRRSMTPVEILQALDKKQEVSRWNCFRNRSELRELVLLPEYRHLEIDVEGQIDLAKDSL